MKNELPDGLVGENEYNWQESAIYWQESAIHWRTEYYNLLANTTPKLTPADSDIPLDIPR